MRRRSRRTGIIRSLIGVTLFEKCLCTHRRTAWACRPHPRRPARPFARFPSGSECPARPVEVMNCIECGAHRARVARERALFVYYVSELHKHLATTTLPATGEAPGVGGGGERKRRHSDGARCEFSISRAHKSPLNSPSNGLTHSNDVPRCKFWRASEAGTGKRRRHDQNPGMCAALFYSGLEE